MIVMKFGGTSMGTGTMIAQVADIVRARMESSPLVVVSAASGVTDMLLGAARQAAAGNEPAPFHGKIRGCHVAILEDLLLDTTMLDHHFAEILEVLKGIYYLRELTLRTKDYVASFGERMSSEILAARFRALGLKARAYPAWDAGFVTTSEFTQARVLPEARDLIRDRLSGLDHLPVVTGFIGKDEAGQITTLGRGGSDFTAAIIGEAVGASEIQIWTDVSGIMTADPRIVAGAKVLPVVSFAEASEMAVFGARVLHPKTIEPAALGGIPVRVKNTFRPDDDGTLILPDFHRESGEISGITSRRDVSVVNLNSTGMLETPGFLSRVFAVFERKRISVDVLATSEVNVSMTVDSTALLEEAMAELRNIAAVTRQDGRSIICLVGEGMKYKAGISGRIFAVLAREGINVEMISQGASQINMTFIVKNEDTATAVCALHDEFFPN
jgi:aspartate kinase